MSSLESHTIVPTLTMLGRVREWIRLLSMAGAAVTRSLLPVTGTGDQRGGKPAPCRGPIGAVRFAWPSLKSVLHVDPIFAATSVAPSTSRRRARPSRHRSPSPGCSPRPGWTAGSPSGWSLAAGALPLRRVPAAAARRPLAGRPYGRLPRPGPGRHRAGHGQRARRVRHHAAVGAHGAAHGAVDGRADLPGARRAGDARPAHPAGPPRAAAARGRCTAGSPGSSRFPLVAFAIFVANPFVLYFTDLYRLHPAARVGARAGARALHHDRLPVLLAAARPGPAARAAGRTRPGRC